MTWRYAAARDADASLLRRLGSVWRHRVLLRRMSERELRLRYAGSSLGRVWAVVFPITLVAFYAAIFTLVFRGRLSGDADQSPQRYALYVVSGLLPWLSLTDVASRAVRTMAEHRSLVKHVMFPVQILPLTAVYAAALPQAAGLVALTTWTVLAGGPQVSWPILALVVLLQVVFLVGVAWLLGALGAVVTDVREVLPIVLTAGMFVTPIFYSAADAPPLLRAAVLANPITHLVNGYRDAFLGGPLRHPESLALLAGIAVVTLLVGFVVFERTRTFLADIL